MKKVLLVLGLVFVLLVIGLVVVRALQQDPITKTAQVTLEVIPAPDFILAVSPPSITSPIDRTIAYNASVTSINFTGEVVFSADGVPSGFTVTYFPSNTLMLTAGETKGVQIDVTPNEVGTYTITVTAESTNYN